MMKGDKSLEKEAVLLERVAKELNDGKTARSLEFTEDEAEIMQTVPLLTMKPVIYVANIAEDEVGTDMTQNEGYMKFREKAEEEGAEILPICAGIEAEIATLEQDEKAEFLEELGLTESGLDRLVKASYSLLGLISFLTAGPQEVRAWTIRKGTRAPQAAGKIHSDFERGFIRAEVISYENLMACGSLTAAKEKGLVRSEGKEYVMNDGDVVLFRFNV